MPVLQIEGDDLFQYNCYLVRAQKNFLQAQEDLSFGDAVYNSSWGDSALTIILRTLKIRGDGIPLNVTARLLARWREQLKTTRASWKRAVSVGNFKAVVRHGSRLIKLVTEYMSWVPSEYVPTSPEGDKP